MKILKLILIVLALPIVIGVLVILLAFIVAISPALTIGFVSYQISGYLKERSYNKTRLEFKLKTNKDYLLYQYKVKRNEAIRDNTITGG